MPIKILVKNALKLFDFPDIYADHDDICVTGSSFPKRRRLLGADVFINPRFTSDDFLCPARDFDTSNRMASNSLFCSMTAVHSGSSPLNQEGKGITRMKATKENVISISDDEDDEVIKIDEKKTANPKSISSSGKEKEWYAPKPFTQREQFLDQNVSMVKGNNPGPEIEIVKTVENGASPREFIPYRRIAVIEKRKELINRSRANLTPVKSRSTPHMSLSAEKMSQSRKLSVNDSFRLEEKKKYSELLQKFTRIPISRLSAVGLLMPNEKLYGKTDDSKRSASEVVEFIDLTKVKDKESSEDSNLPEIEVLEDKRKLSIAAKTGDDSSKTVNHVIKKIKEHPVYDPNWASDLSLIHDHKKLDRRRKEEQEKLKIQLKSKESKEIVQNFLEEQIQTHMRITEIALPEEIISLDDEELKLPKLTSQMQRLVNSAFHRGNPREVLVEGFNLSITRHDIQTLSSTNWLNDEVINFYMNLLIERGKEGKYPKVYAFNTFFYPKLLQSGYASLKRWTRKVDLFAHDIIIVPVHLSLHWCMAAIDLRKKTIQYYDSMGASNKTCLDTLMRYLDEEMMDKKKQKFDRKGWATENVKKIPQQMNGSDCGMFACMYSEFLCRDAKINFSQTDMPYFRHKMAYEILSKKLLL